MYLNPVHDCSSRWLSQWSSKGFLQNITLELYLFSVVQLKYLFLRGMCEQAKAMLIVMATPLYWSLVQKNRSVSEESKSGRRSYYSSHYWQTDTAGNVGACANIDETFTDIRGI